MDKQFRNETVILEFKRTNFGNKKNPLRNQTDKKESKRVIILVVLLEQCFVRIGNSEMRNKFQPRPQNRIFIPLRGSFQDFRP